MIDLKKIHIFIKRNKFNNHFMQIMLMMIIYKNWVYNLNKSCNTISRKVTNTFRDSNQLLNHILRKHLILITIKKTMNLKQGNKQIQWTIKKY